MKRKVRRAVRHCAAGKLSWRDLAKYGLVSYTHVLAAMADLNLRPYMAPLTGPNVETRTAGMKRLEDILTGDKSPDES
jgi:hypothetical protein